MGEGGRVSGEDEVDVVELGAGTDKAVFEIGFVAVQRHLALLP